MTASELLEKIESSKDTRHRNSMGCLEDWYDFTFAMKETFTKDEIESMSERELTLLERLATSIQDGLY